MPAKSIDSLQYLIDAVSASAVMNISDLQAGNFLRADNTQRAEYFMGKTAVTFSFRLQKELKAIKIWPGVTSEELRQRYAITEKYLNKRGFDYFVKSSYIKEGVDLNGVHYDALVMDWAGRQTFKEYIYANIDHKENINELAEKILLIHKSLNKEFIAHGRFHADNIHIDANNKIRLIGYDSVFILGEMGLNHFDATYPDYTHPSGQLKGLKADYFAALILYLGCKAIAHDKVLWGRYKVGFQEGFLFNASDFTDIKNASIYNYLRKIQTPEIRSLLDILVLYCEAKNATGLSPFYTYLEKDLALVHKPVTVIKNFVVKQAETNNDKAVFIQHTDKPVAANEKINKPAPLTIVTEKNVPITTKDQQHEDAPSEIIPVAKPVRVKAKKETKAQTLPGSKKKFLIGVTLIGLGIIATGYLLNKRTDKADFPSRETVKKVQKSQDVIANGNQGKKIQPVIKAIKDSLTTDSLVNNKPAGSLAENHPAMPSVPSQETAGTVNKITPGIGTVKASTTEIIAPQVNTSGTATDAKNKTSQLLTDNSNPTDLLAERKSILARNATAGKTNLKKANGSKKQNSASFIIGTPPKK
jgi:hypothetical protein